jgi:hypothetical protein
MAALTADRNTISREGGDFEYPVAAATKIYAGSMVGFNAGAAYATKGLTSTTLKGIAVAQELADNSAGAAGDINVKVRRGVFRFANSAAGDLISLADCGSDCYVVDDQTVAKTNGTGTRSVAGKVRDVDAGGVWVEF